jgi:predicted MFS family arabinose efflux permease
MSLGGRLRLHTPERRDQVLASYPRGNFKVEFVKMRTSSALSGFTLANLPASMAQGYAGLMASRILLAPSAASLMPAASGYAADSGGRERPGRALSMVTKGLILALIAGAPLGVLVGEGLGWRSTLFVVAGLAALVLLGMPARPPPRPVGATASLGERLALAGRGDMLGVLTASVPTIAGTFAIYTYLGAFLAEAAGIGPKGCEGSRGLSPPRRMMNRSWCRSHSGVNPSSMMPTSRQRR